MRLPPGSTLALRFDSAVLVTKPLLSIIWGILSHSSRSLARHMAQLAAAVAIVA
jgi:hypothetical protein